MYYTHSAVTHVMILSRIECSVYTRAICVCIGIKSFKIRWNDV